MNKKKLFIYLVIILAIDSSMMLNATYINNYKNTPNVEKKSSVKLLSNFTIDSSWEIIDTTTTAATSLDDIINNYIALGKTKFYIKDGVYNLNDSIKINLPNVIIYGQSKENTKIIQPSTGKNNIEVTANNVQVSNLTIDNRQGEIAFTSKNCNNIKLENCIIYGSPNNSAIAFWGTTGISDIYAVENNNLTSSNIIQGNTIYSHPIGSLKDGLIFMKQMNGSITNNTIIGSRIAFYLCRNSEVSSNTIKDSDTNGIRVTVPAYDNKILNNSITNTLASGICLVRNDTGATSANYRASGFEISDNTITNSRYFGIEISNLKNSNIANNVISNMDFDGIYLLYADNLNVTQNKIYNSGLATATNGRKLWTWNEGLNSGIFIDYSVCNSSLDNNLITNAYNNCVYGIRMQSSSSNLNNSIIYNTITGDFSTGIDANTASPENTIIYGNAITLNSIPAPTNLITVSSIDNIELSWDQVPGATEYELDVDGSVINNITTSSYVNTGLISSNSYTYRVRAIGGNWSNFVTATTLPSVPPPSNTTTESSIVIIPPSTNTTTESSVTITPTPANTTSGSSVTTKPNSNAESSGGKTTTKAKKTKKSKKSKLPTPDNITTIPYTNKIIINWNKVKKATDYEIEVNGDIINNGDNNYYVDTDLMDNSSYTYRVRAIGGIWSNFITVKTLHVPQPMPVPKINMTVPSSTNNIIISLNPIPKNTTYEIDENKNTKDITTTTKLSKIAPKLSDIADSKLELPVSSKEILPKSTQPVVAPNNIVATPQLDNTINNINQMEEDTTIKTFLNIKNFMKNLETYKILTVSASLLGLGGILKRLLKH